MTKLGKHPQNGCMPITKQERILCTKLVFFGFVLKAVEGLRVSFSCWQSLIPTLSALKFKGENGLLWFWSLISMYKYSVWKRLSLFKFKITNKHFSSIALAQAWRRLTASICSYMWTRLPLVWTQISGSFKKVIFKNSHAHVDKALFIL